MPSTNSARSTKTSGFSLARMIGPAIPVLIPVGMTLVHGARTSTVAAPTTAPAAIVSRAGSQPGMGDGFVPVLAAPTLLGMKCGGGAGTPACAAPYPMLAKGHPVDWFFVFKLNAAKFPECGGGTRTCPFGGSTSSDTPPTYKTAFGQQYVYASSEGPQLLDGLKDCLGTTTADPVGATFDEVYNGGFHFVIWNDQFKELTVACSTAECDAPWGHSKGLLAWNDAGEGMVMQVSTPSWPVSGRRPPKGTPGKNTLGCMTDNDVEVSQHFFALRLSRDDLIQVLNGLENASVVTAIDPKLPQIASNGGPADVQSAVNALGHLSTSTEQKTALLSTNVRLISKPSDLNVPPWQLVSAMLGGIPLRTATWWTDPEIPATTTDAKPACWTSTLPAPGSVDIATSGHWRDTEFSLKGGPATNGNHAKLGVSKDATEPYAIFGDMNQQGTLSGVGIDSKGKPITCASSQNGRGGLFFVMNYAPFSQSLTELISPPPGGSPAPAP